MASLRDIVRSIDELPTIPAVAARALAVADDPASSARDLYDIIVTDPPLAAKILRVANSAYFSRGRIVDLRLAIVQMGVRNVRNLALGLSVIRLFPGAFRGLGFTREDFWRHCIAVGMMSSVIAETLPGVSCPTAFAAGLLHDIGKIVLDRWAHEDFLRLLRLSEQRNISFLEAERALGLFDHAALSGELLEAWSFPEALRQPVRCHHDPAAAAEPDRPYAVIVHVADYLCGVRRLGLSGSANPMPPDQSYLDYVGFHKVVLSEVGEWLAEMRQANDALLNW
jgi:HD-like signal output (HDOD) protein